MTWNGILRGFKPKHDFTKAVKDVYEKISLLEEPGQSLFVKLVNGIYDQGWDIHLTEVPGQEYRVGLKDPKESKAKHASNKGYISYSDENVKIGYYPRQKEQLYAIKGPYVFNDDGVTQFLKAIGNARRSPSDKPHWPCEYSRPTDEAGEKQPQEKESNATIEVPMMNFPLNIILYGPPGTGKTFATPILSLCPFATTSLNKSETLGLFWQRNLQNPVTPRIWEAYSERVKNDRIRFVTFHQSYSYEDFVEGISARTASNGAIEYYQKQGVFKKIAAAALSEAMGKGQLAVEKENDPRELNAIFREAHKRATEPPPPAKVSTEQNAERKELEPYVLIIDEINRGNVAKIFGELITLIEDSKRLKLHGAVDPSKGDQPTGAVLPLSGDTLYVPDNLYIVATMNTADRSLIGMDMAMRRRFEFIELPPKPELLPTDRLDDKSTFTLQGFLKALNERIATEDTPDHQIGHAYLLKVDNKAALITVMKNKIIPQLRENLVGRESILQNILSKDSKGTNSLVDKHGRPDEDTLKILDNYPQ